MILELYGKYVYNALQVTMTFQRYNKTCMYVSPQFQALWADVLEKLGQSFATHNPVTYTYDSLHALRQQHQTVYSYEHSYTNNTINDFDDSPDTNNPNPESGTEPDQSFGEFFSYDGIIVWPNRDPIEEFGGLNIYAFLNNQSLIYVDLLGLKNSGVSNLCNKDTVGDRFITDIIKFAVFSRGIRLFEVEVDELLLANKEGRDNLSLNHIDESIVDVIDKYKKFVGMPGKIKDIKDLLKYSKAIPMIMKKIIKSPYEYRYKKPAVKAIKDELKNLEKLIAGQQEGLTLRLYYQLGTCTCSRIREFFGGERYKIVPIRNISTDNLSRYNCRNHDFNKFPFYSLEPLTDDKKHYNNCLNDFLKRFGQ